MSVDCSLIGRPEVACAVHAVFFININYNMFQNLLCHRVYSGAVYFSFFLLEQQQFISMDPVHDIIHFAIPTKCIIYTCCMSNKQRMLVILSAFCDPNSTGVATV